MIALEEAVNYNVADFRCFRGRPRWSTVWAPLNPWCRRKLSSNTGAGPRAGPPPPASHMSDGRAASFQLRLSLLHASHGARCRRSAVRSPRLNFCRDRRGNELASLHVIFMRGKADRRTSVFRGIPAKACGRDRSGPGNCWP